jgi:hypothetical protein
MAALIFFGVSGFFLGSVISRIVKRAGSFVSKIGGYHISIKLNSYNDNPDLALKGLIAGLILSPLTMACMSALIYFCIQYMIAGTFLENFFLTKLFFVVGLFAVSFQAGAFVSWELSAYFQHKEYVQNKSDRKEGKECDRKENLPKRPSESAEYDFFTY